MAITKQTSEGILKRGSLRGIDAALVNYKDLYLATDDIEARLDDLEDGTLGSLHLTGTLEVDGTSTFNDIIYVNQINELSATLRIKTQNQTGSTVSNNLTINSGNTDSANTGTVVLFSGDVATAGNTGDVGINSGSTPLGTTGDTSIGSGNSTLGNTGDNTIFTGDATTGSSGDIIIRTGTGTGTTGTIYFKPGNTTLMQIDEVEGLTINRDVVTQLTNINTGVTINSITGLITTVTTTAAAVTSEIFTVTNSFADTTSRILVSINDYSGTYATNGFPSVTVDNKQTGTFDIVVTNLHATNALNGILEISFFIIN